MRVIVVQTADFRLCEAERFATWTACPDVGAKTADGGREGSTNGLGEVGEYGRER